MSNLLNNFVLECVSFRGNRCCSSPVYPLPLEQHVICQIVWCTVINSQFEGFQKEHTLPLLALLSTLDSYNL